MNSTKDMERLSLTWFISNELERQKQKVGPYSLLKALNPPVVVDTFFLSSTGPQTQTTELSLHTPSQMAPRSMCQRPSANHEHFPGNFKRTFKIGQTWFARPGAAGLLFQLTLGRNLSLRKKKKKKKQNIAATGVHNLVVRHSCSCNNVVEPVGNFSCPLDTVLGHDLSLEEE